LRPPFRSQEARKLVVHLGVDELLVGPVDPAIVELVDFVIRQIGVRDVLEFDGIHDNGADSHGLTLATT
jgi:hypothetical protein